jgi:peptidyl-prolyl cis-trans isomerase SurA
MIKYFVKTAFLIYFSFAGIFNLTATEASLSPSRSQVSEPKVISSKIVPAKIAVKVNNDLISYQDIEERISLVLISASDQSSAERSKVFAQVKHSLIQERLQKQLCKDLKIQVSQAEIDEAVKNIAKDNEMTVDEMKKMFATKKVPLRTLEKRLEAQMAWLKAAQSAFSHQVHVSEQDAKQALEKLENKQNKTQYELSEIVMYVDSKNHEKQVLADMNNVRHELDKGASVRAMAQQFSQSTSASKGGYIGWFSQGQRTAAEEAAIKGLKTGFSTPPIRFNGGYRILFLHDVREPGKASQGETKVTYWTLTIPFEELSNADKELIQYRIDELKNAPKGVDQFEKLVKKWGYKIDKPSPVVMRDLPEVWEKSFKQNDTGTVIGPINEGSSLILAIICRKELPKSVEKPKLQDITNQLYSQKLEKIMTREFNKLMSVAFIEDLTAKKSVDNKQSMNKKNARKADAKTAA